MKNWLAGLKVATAKEKASAAADREVAQSLATLEASVTPRHLRGAALGDQFAIDHIQTVEDAIAALGVRS